QTCYTNLQTVVGNVNVGGRRQGAVSPPTPNALLTVCVDPSLGPKAMVFPTTWPPMPPFLDASTYRWASWALHAGMESLSTTMRGPLMDRPQALFDLQADTYDRRMGLPEQDCQAIVRAVLALAHVQPHDLLLEIGAGTGMIGTWFAQQPLHYVGLDLSRGMLAVFRQRLSHHSGTLL